MKYKYTLILVILATLAVFYATRFANINHDNPDEDTFSWLYRINYYPWIVSSNLQGQDLGDRDLKYAGTISYHPGVTVMTFSGISTKIGKALKLKEDPQYEPCPYLDFKCEYLDYELFIAKIPIVIIGGILFGFSMLLLSLVFSIRSLIVWVLVVLFEHLLAGSSTALHLDYLFGMFTIAAISCLVYAVSRNSRFMILAGVFMGLALLTRFAGSFMIPGIIASLFYLDKKNFIKNVFLFGIGGIISFVGFYPSMWVAPVETLTYIMKSSAEISDNLAGVLPVHIRYINSFVWYFGVYKSALSLTSIVVLVTGIIGLFSIKNENRKYAYTILIVYLTYFAFVNLADKQYIRYLVPVVIGLMIPASIGSYNLVYLLIKKIGIR